MNHKNNKFKYKNSNYNSEKKNIFSSPENFIFKIAAYIKDNLNFSNTEENIKKEINNIEINLENFISDIKIKNEREKFDKNKKEISLQEEIENNNKIHSIYKRFYSELINLFPNTKVIFEKIINGIDNNHLYLLNKNKELSEKLDFSESFHESKNFILN